MNFVKRAGMSLAARKSSTALLLGIFAVICTLLLGGFLLSATADRREADAQRDIGVDVTVLKEGLDAARADRLGAADVVYRHNLQVPVRAGAAGFAPLAPGGPGGGTVRLPLAVTGIHDSELLLPFSYGSVRTTSGRGITPADADRRVVAVEERLAKRNRLAVGDTLRVRPADGTRAVPLEIVGVFRDPTRDPSGPVRPYELPGNALYVPVRTAQQLGAGPGAVREAVYRIGSPEQAERLHAAADELLGPGSFEFRVNDRAYRDQVRPLRQVGAFASLVVWVIALAGALILGLLVTLQIRERRGELGVLLAMGERKWKLVGQHTAEIAALVLPAVAVAAAVGLAAGGPAGDALLDEPAVTETTGPGRAAAPGVRVEPAAVAKVAGLGLGISLVATAVPGIGILRLHPRSILTDSE